MARAAHQIPTREIIWTAVKNQFRQRSRKTGTTQAWRKLSGRKRFCFRNRAAETAVGHIDGQRREVLAKIGQRMPVRMTTPTLDRYSVNW